MLAYDPFESLVNGKLLPFFLALVLILARLSDYGFTNVVRVGVLTVGHLLRFSRVESDEEGVGKLARADVLASWRDNCERTTDATVEFRNMLLSQGFRRQGGPRKPSHVATIGADMTVLADLREKRKDFLDPPHGRKPQVAIQREVYNRPRGHALANDREKVWVFVFGLLEQAANGKMNDWRRDERAGFPELRRAVVRAQRWEKAQMKKVAQAKPHAGRGRKRKGASS